MSLFPVFLKLEGEPALVVGGGTLAQGKIQALLHARAKVRVVAPQAQGHIAEWAQRGLLQWQARVFKPTDTRGNRLVYAATGLPAIDRAVADECRRAGVLCNAVDDPPHCDFYSPAVVQRGDLQIAISTNGQSPALAQQIRQRLESEFDETWTTRLTVLGKERRRIRSLFPAGEERNRLLHELARRSMATSTTTPIGAQPDVTTPSESQSQTSKRETFTSSSLNLVFRLRDAIVRWLREEDDKVALI